MTVSDSEVQQIVQRVVARLRPEDAPTQRPAASAAVKPAAAGSKVVAIGADHGGFALKGELKLYLQGNGYDVLDLGTHSTEAVDYPDLAEAVARKVASGEAWRGIVIDGAGLGSAIAANKIRGARAAMCTTPTLARYAREHNGANVLALGATLITPAEARDIVDVWLSTPTREPRYLRRLLKIRGLEERF